MGARYVNCTINDPLFGAIIKTKYALGRLQRVFSIKRNCDCPTYLSEINNLGGIPPKTTPHLHFVTVSADTPYRERYYVEICQWFNQLIPLGGGRFGDIPECRGWRFKYFILRIVDRDTGPPLFFQEELFQ